MNARRRYAAIIRTPHVARLMGTALLARAPLGIDGLAIVLFVRGEYGSYATAGLVAAMFAIGAALVAPIMGRLVDRLGARRILVPLAIVHACALGAVVAFGTHGASVVVLCAAGLIAGCAIPPVGSVLRALWPELLAGHREELLTAAYALDAVLLEIAFIVGPIFVAVVASLASPQLALVASVVFVTAGTLLFTATPMARAFSPADDHAHDTGGRLGALRSPGVRTLVLSTVPIGFCLGAAEVSFPAFGEYVGSRALAGPLLALWSLGSAIGGLIYGAYGHRIPISSAYLRTAALLPLVTLPLALPSTFVAMVPLAILAGLAVAPLLSAGNQLIGDVAPRGAVTEAFTWPLTALVAGVAGGNAVAGAIVQSHDWRVAFVAAAGVGALGVVVATLRRSTLRPVPA
ncbi:MAG TPA: MFS transporter [Solirubrobacteraceae bacterium]